MKLLLSLGFIAALLTGCRPADSPSVVPVTPTTTPAAVAATTTGPVTPPVVELDQTPTDTPAAEPTTSPPSQPDPTPKPMATVNLSVPFTSQAPYQMWDALHGEACEEASMIMAAAYFNGETLTAHTAEQQILNLINWESVNSYQVDVTAAETVQILKDYYNLEAVAVFDVTVERIKQELSDGRLVIVPAAGRELGNPYYTPPGPIYHMLVIRGYTDKEFITNDPGTKRGEEYRYSYKRLLDAVHDWDHARAVDGMTDEEMAQGAKVMVVVYPPN